METVKQAADKSGNIMLIVGTSHTLNGKETGSSLMHAAI